MAKVIKIYRIQSFSDPEKKYEVQVFDDKMIICDCPIATFRPAEECKHIKRIKKLYYEKSKTT